MRVMLLALLVALPCCATNPFRPKLNQFVPMGEVREVSPGEIMARVETIGGNGRVYQITHTYVGVEGSTVKVQRTESLRGYYAQPGAMQLLELPAGKKRAIRKVIYNLSPLPNGNLEYEIVQAPSEFTGSQASR